MSSRLRTRPRLLVGAAAIAAAGLLAACSTNAPGAGAGPGSQPLNGITADSVKVGYTIVDVGTLEATLGFKQPAQGGVEGLTKVINALVKHVNDNGGMGGRQVVADIKPYVATKDSTDSAAALCSGFTQDDQVFAAVLDGQFQNNALPCYKAANTLIIEETAIAHDATQFAQYSPYLWSPTHPEYGSFFKTQLQSLIDRKFFDGNTGVQLIPVDTEVARRVTTTIAEPALKAAGITNVKVDYVDGTNIGTIGATSSAAMAAGKAGGYNRVVVIGGARVLGITLADQNAPTYLSNWSISSWDIPYFMETNTDTESPERLENMVGLGYAPTYDVGPDAGLPFPDPSRPAEGICKDIIDKAGATPPEGQRPNYRNAFQFCDATMFLKAALDKAPRGGGLTGIQFRDAVGQIGTGYASASTFGSLIEPGKYAATNAARVLVFDSSCKCFRYDGENVSLLPNGEVSGGSGTAPSAPATGPASPEAVPTITITP